MPVPGGGGSGGSVLLQVGDSITQGGTIDVRGGTGSVVDLLGFYACDTRGGDASDGGFRLEHGSLAPPVAALGRTLPAATVSDVGPLRERDQRVVQFSQWYPVSSTGPGDALTLARYEIDVRVGGTTLTYTDDPARFNPANQSGQPVRIRFRGEDERNATVGPWRDLVTAEMAGIAADFPTRFRFELTFDRAYGSDAVVEELRVIAR